MTKIPQKLIDQTRFWLGPAGFKFFSDVKAKYGRLDATWVENGVTHKVQIQEGADVRVWLKKSGHCGDWTNNVFDTAWVDVIQAALDAGPLTP